jgi:hypothetical protein
MIKSFERCINVKSPEFIKLSNTFGYATSSLLTRLNNMEIPSENKAKEILLKERQKQFDDIINYINSSQIVDIVGLNKHLKKFMTPNHGLYIVNHTDTQNVSKYSFSEKTFGKYKDKQTNFSKEVHDKNVKALTEIQRKLQEVGYSDVFKIESNKTTIGSQIKYNKEKIDEINTKKAEYIDDEIEYFNEKETGKQGSFFKLSPIQNQDKYDAAKGEWKFSPKFNEPQQLNIINTLTGLTFQYISKAILDGKSVNIFTKDIVNDIPQIATKKVYQKKLNELIKQKDLSLQDTELKNKLQELLKPEVWNKFQNSVLNNIKQFGFQINKKSGDVVQMDVKDEDFETPITTEEDEPQDVLSENESTGKAKNFSDYGEYTIFTKDKLSPRLKVWLSSIPSTEESFIAVNFPNLSVTTTYVPIDVVINAINEATVGKRTPETIIASLEKYAKENPNASFLNEVVRRLKLEQNQDSTIPNEFFSKFNQTKNEMVMVKTFTTPKRINGEIVKDENGEITYDIHSQVININRNDIPNNLKDAWFQDFSFEYSEEKDEELVVSRDSYKKVYDGYTKFKDSILKNFDSFGNLANEAVRPEVIQNINKLFASIGVELNTEVVNKLINGGFKGSRFKIGNDSIFTEKFGILGQIFSEFKPDIQNAERGFGSTGMNKIANEQAKYVDNFMNTSAKDGKNRSIWAYGLNNPFTREMFDILASAKELAAQKEAIKQGANINQNAEILDLLQTHYSNKSEILTLLSTLEGESLETFMNNLSWSIFNVTKSSVKGAKGKELKNMNEREFINSQLHLFTNNTLSSKVNGVEKKWSYKFLTTPSDKTTMFVVRTPDHTVSLFNDLISVKPETVNVFYNKFLGEYNKIKAYLEGTEEYKKSIDDIETYEPKVFYNFSQFNVKSKFLWEDKTKLRNLDEVVDGIKVETYIKDKIKEQIEQDIAQTRLDWEKYGLIENGKLVAGINQNYLESIPRGISNIGNISVLQKAVKDKPELKVQLDELISEADRKTTSYLIADFAINKHLHNIEMSMFVLGDPTMFLKNANQKITEEQFKNSNLEFWKDWGNKVRDNLSKRMAGLQGSGTEAVWKTETANTIVIRDPKFTSKAIEELVKFNPELAKKYQEIDSLDGQELVTPQEDLALKLAQGKIKESEYNDLLKKVEKQEQDIEKQGFISEENLFDENETYIAQAQKPLVWALIPDTFSKIRKVTYNKPSAFGLYPQFTQGLEIDKIRQSIYKHNKDNTRVDRIVMLSAAKLGAKAPISDVFNQDGTVNEFTVNQESIDEIPRKYFRIQLEVPYKKSEEIRILTQSVKLMFTESLDTTFDTSSLNIDNKELSGQELKDYHDSIYQETFNLHYENFLIDTGAEKTPLNNYAYKDYKKLQETLKEHAITQGYDLNELEGLELNEDNNSFKLPLAFSAKADKYEKLLLSLINDIILQKIHGRSFVLATEAGFKLSKTEVKEGTEANDWVNYNKSNLVFTETYNPETGLLPQRPDPNNPGKTLPAQVMISFKFFDAQGNKLNLKDFTYEKDGHTFLNTKKLSPELLKIIGIRVPTQAHASMADIEVVGFIPDFMGDLIIAPQDFTKQMGSDFDIDKLYSYMYNYQYYNGKLKRLKFDEELVRKNKESKRDESTEKRLKAIFGEDYIESEIENKENFEKFINKQKIKILQNQLQDIYHVVLSNIEVYEKMIEGITEGNLPTLAEELSKINKKSDTQLPSLASDRYKVTEYFDNAAGKMGIGVYSANSTFFSLIEGKEIQLQKQKTIIVNGKKTKGTLPNPFIVKDINGKDHEYLKLSGKGFNKLISMFQSASVDNAKLKILSLLNIDINTMGISAVMASISDDNIKVDGKPVYNEDYIIKFISQPVIVEYLEGLKKGSDDVKKNPDKNWKITLFDSIKKKYTQKLIDEIGEDQAFALISQDYKGYSIEDLDFGIIENKLNTNTDNAKYLKMQLDIADQFRYFEDVSKLVRKVQNLVNTDSKGTSQTIQESIFKQQKLTDLLESSLNSSSPLVLSNLNEIFNGVTNRLFELGVDLPIAIYKGNTTNSPVLPYGTTKYESFIKDFKILQNKSEEEDFFNSQEASNLWNGFLSYIWSYPELNIADKNLSEERYSLIKDDNTNKSLATQIEEFRNTALFINNPILKPLLNSLKAKPSKKDPTLNFTEFSVSVGLINPDTEIILSLEYLRQINEPLFNNLIKYTLLVTPANSPTSLRKFIPNFYLEAIGATKTLNTINKQLNIPYSKAEDNVSISEQFPPISKQHYQIFQHYPNHAFNIDIKSNLFNEDKSKISIPQTNKNEQFTQVYSNQDSKPAQVPLQFLSTFDSELKKWRLYTLKEYIKEDLSTIANYEEIPTLGDYNLSEFDIDGDINKPSILTKNNPKNYKYIPSIKEQKVIKQPIIEEIKPATEVVVINPIGSNTGHLENNYGYSNSNTSKQNVSNILDNIMNNSTNKSYKILAKILLEVNKNQNILSGINFVLGNVNQYQSNDNTIIIKTNDDSKTFQKTFQYNFLHEIVHYYTVKKLTDGSQIGKTVLRNIEGLIQELEKPENLQKAIDLLNLKTTSQELLSKLTQLRNEQEISAEESLVGFSSEEERSILNPLINSFEFISSIMNDENTQKWMNEINYPESKLNIFEKVVDYLKGLFNNFIRSLNINLKTSEKTALNQGIENVMQLLNSSKSEGQLDLFTLLKPISKLTEIKQAEIEVKREAVLRMEDRRNLLWNEHNKILLNEKLTKEEKSTLLEPLFKRIEKMNNSIEKLKNNFNVSLLEEESLKSLEYVKNILDKEEPTVSELQEARLVLNTMQSLIEVGVQNKESLSSDLKQVLININKDISAQQTLLNDFSKESVTAHYNTLSGQTYTPEQMFNANIEGGTRSTWLNGEDNHNPLVQYTSLVAGDMTLKTEAEITDRTINETPELTKFTNKFDFRNLLQITDVKDELTGIIKKVKNFKTRLTPKFFEAKREIFQKAKNITGANKTANIRSKLNEIEFVIDLRYLFPEEFNKDMGESKLKETDKTKYLENLTKFIEEEYSEYSKEYAKYRLDEVIEQTQKRFEPYIEKRNYAFELIEEEYPGDDAVQTLLKNNWLAYNSPFLLLNERFALSPENMKLKVQAPYSKFTAKVIEDNQTINVPWVKINLITGKEEKVRISERYTTNKPRRKDFNGNITGYINDEYTGWEVEYFEKVVPAIEKGKQEPPTMLGFLKYVQELQQEYLGLLPRYLNKDVSYFSMLDVPKDWKELIDDAKGFQKLTLLPILAWDSVVNAVSKPFIEKEEKRLSLITKQQEKEFNPKFQHDSFNQKGYGDLKTDDVFRYFDFIRNVTVTYKYKAIAEQNLKEAQALYSQGVLTNANKEAFTKDKDLHDWIINHKLYGQQKDSKQPSDYNIKGDKSYQLTKSERDRVNILKAQIKQLEDKYPDFVPEDVNEELFKIQEQISKIQRTITPGTVYDASESYLRLKFLGWSALGRLYDTVATAYIGNISEAIDGRIFKQTDLLNSLGVVNASYGAGYVGSLGVTSAGVVAAGSLLPGAAPILGIAGYLGVGGAIGLGTQKIVDQTQLKQKVSQLLLRTGALDHFDFLSETDQRNILSGTLEILNPYNLLQQADVYNKATTVIAVIYGTKIKDKSGNTRPLWDAFVTENGQLTWNNEEFDSQESLNMNFTGENSEVWFKLRFKTERALKSVHGDMASDFGTSLSRKNTGQRMLLFMKTYITQAINKQFSMDIYDPLSQQRYVGKTKGFVSTVIKSVKGEEYTEQELAAYRQFQFQMSLWMGFAVAAKIIYNSIKENKDDNQWWWTLLNITNRIGSDQGVTLDPDLGRYRQVTQIFPHANYGSQIFDVSNALSKAAFGDEFPTFEQRDYMTRQEMIRNKLIPKNEIVDIDVQWEWNENKEKFEEVKKYKVFDPTTGKTSKFLKEPKWYNEEYEKQSRTFYKLKKVLPFTSAYKSIENSRKPNNLIK